MAAVLPRTTSFQRRRPQRWWSLAVAIAVVVNLAVVVVLAQISRMRFDEPEPPLAVRVVRQAPPPPAPASVAQAADAGPGAAAPVALPALDLPALPTGRLVLPEMWLPELPTNLPLEMPAVVAVGSAVVPVGVPDTPAVRLGELDLNRFYPRAARQRGTAGTTRVLLDIDASGVVTQVTVLASQPAEVFDRAAERLGLSLRHEPARRGGMAVASQQELIIQWEVR